MILDLHNYTTTKDTERVQEELRADHPEFQRRAVDWACVVLEGVAKLDGAWVDDRNRFAVETARRMLDAAGTPRSWR